MMALDKKLKEEPNKIEPLPDYINLFVDLSDFVLKGRYAMIQDDVDDAGSYVELLVKKEIKSTISD